MAYKPLLTIADIETFYPTIKFSETTKPNSYQIEGWIGEATSAVYASISNVYAVPVTDKDDLNILMMVARSYVLPHVASVLRNNAFSPASKTGSKQKMQTVDLERFDTWISKLIDRSLNLPNSAKSTSAIVKSYNVDNAITPASSKTEDLW